MGVAVVGVGGDRRKVVRVCVEACRLSPGRGERLRCVVILAQFSRDLAIPCQLGVLLHVQHVLVLLHHLYLDSTERWV